MLELGQTLLSRDLHALLVLVFGKASTFAEDGHRNRQVFGEAENVLEIVDKRFVIRLPHSSHKDVLAERPRGAKEWNVFQ